MGFRFLLGRHFGWLHQLVGHCGRVGDLHLSNLGGDVLEGVEEDRLIESSPSLWSFPTHHLSVGLLGVSVLDLGNDFFCGLGGFLFDLLDVDGELLRRA